MLLAPTWTIKLPAAVKVNQTFRLEWNAVSGATSYYLEQTERGNVNQTTTIYSGTSTIYQQTLLRVLDDFFYYSVQACMGSQCSAWTQAPGDGTELTSSGQPASGISSP